MSLTIKHYDFQPNFYIFHIYELNITNEDECSYTWSSKSDKNAYQDVNKNFRAQPKPKYFGRNQEPTRKQVSVPGLAILVTGKTKNSW